MTMLAARAHAHANIALAKYWGKLDAGGNLPAVPSVSVTLDALTTTTEVRFDSNLCDDQLVLNDQPASEPATRRMVAMLDEIRERAGIRWRAAVRSSNNFPTAAGLASSASAFAALALAASRAAGLTLSESQLSDLARRSSASAARSLFGGFVQLPAGQPGSSFLAASRLAPASHWDVRLVVAVNSRKSKAIGSTEGMKHTAATSPYFDAWVELSRELAPRVAQAILARDLQALGQAAEQSALAMHACAMASDPALVYFEPATIACLRQVRALRESGIAAWATIDAGPHVKVLTTPEHLQEVMRAIANTEGVLNVIASGVGGDATVELVQS